MQRPAQSEPKPHNNKTDIAGVSLFLNLDRPYNQFNASSLYLEHTFVCRVVQLLFKNVMRNKKVYTCKSEKIPETVTAPNNR